MIQGGIILASQVVKQESSSNLPPRDIKSALLATGALLGALLAGSGLVEPAGGSLPSTAIASVNGELISKAEYLELLASISVEKSGPLTDADRHKLLERMIEEKLLINRGLEIGLPWSDPETSRSIVNAMIAIAINETRSLDPDEAELRRFFEANRNYFERPGQVWVKRMVFRGDDTENRASTAYERLGHEPWNRIEDELADRDIAAPPDELISATRLRRYLGRQQAEIALALPEQGWSQPLPSQGGFDILWLLELIPAVIPGYTDISEQVRHEYERRASDRALREYLEQLRNTTRVAVDKEFLEGLEGGDARAP